MELARPDVIVEWIPYNNLQNIKHLTKGGFSEIYKAVLINGKYEEWDSKKQQLERFGDQYVVLKELKNVENANQKWFEEVKSHLTIKPRNATKEELEAFYSGNNPNLHSKEQNYLEIPDDTNEL
ncbi:unnamed protein product [Rhizophagus irregularis]|nr:unnamed protein product [Rhizophagus irregularis]CAB4478911.1 unnamed protein product [Rhizophagus irregularis]